MRVTTVISGLAYLFFQILNNVPAFSQGKWERLPGPYGASVQQIEQDGGFLYALCSGGMYKSGDEGENWALLDGEVSMGVVKPTFNWFGKLLQIEGK